MSDRATHLESLYVGARLDPEAPQNSNFRLRFNSKVHHHISDAKNGAASGIYSGLVRDTAFEFPSGVRTSLALDAQATSN